jgi:phosphoglycolate phosphatase
MNYIFDFDGTIANSLSIILAAIKKIDPDISRDDLAREELVFLSQPIWKYFLNEFRFRELKVLLKSKSIRKEVEKNMINCQPYPGIIEVIKKLKKENNYLAIITSSNFEIVKAFLIRNNIDFFDDIISNVSFLGKPKAIKYLLIKNSLNENESFYIGDELRDYEAAKQSKVIPIPVSWGIYSKEQFERLGIKCIISPTDIIK